MLITEQSLLEKWQSLDNDKKAQVLALINHLTYIN